MSKLVRPRSMPSRPRAMAGAYEGASSTIEGLSTWLPSFGSADEDLLGDLAMLRARNRDLSNNNGIASSAIQTITDNVVGTGMRLSAKPDYQALGRDKAWADVTGRRIEALWRSWADGTDCDAGRTLNFAGLTQLAFRSGLLNGEALALPLWLPGRGAFATRIQLIEADRLTKPPHIMDGASMRDGIEIDRHGAPRAYWIRKTHPGDSYVYGASPDEWRRIRAETRWGRRR
ncbi:MAG: phage portal protein, partial [bacterium]|nr:phage portal protein [bacterium]